MFVDLEQGSGKRGDNMSRHLGAFVCHGTSWSQEDRVIMSPLGRLLAMGFQMPPFAAEEFVCSDFATAISKLSSAQVAKLAGNGYHLSEQLLIFVYIMMNVRRRSELDKLAPPPPIEFDDLSSDDGGDD